MNSLPRALVWAEEEKEKAAEEEEEGVGSGSGVDIMLFLLPLLPFFFFPSFLFAHEKKIRRWWRRGRKEDKRWSKLA